MKKVKAIIEKGSDGLYSVYVDEDLSVTLNGQGDSIEEAMEDLHVALKEAKELLESEGEPIPEDIKGEIKFEYLYDVKSLFNRFDEIKVSNFAYRIGMNASLLRRKASGEAATYEHYQKIRKGLNELANDLLSV